MLIGAFATIQGHPGVQEFWNLGVSALNDPVDPAFAREFQTSTLAHPIADEYLDTYVNESLKVPARIWQALFRGFLDTPAFGDQLNKVTAPTLIMWGDRDTFATRADQDALHAAMPDARLRAYPGGGHALHWEAPSRIAADVASFVTEGR